MRARMKCTDGYQCAVVTIIEEGCSCADIARQRPSVVSASVNAERTRVNDHMDHRLDAQGSEPDTAEFATTPGYL